MSHSAPIAFQHWAGPSAGYQEPTPGMVKGANWHSQLAPLTRPWRLGSIALDTRSYSSEKPCKSPRLGPRSVPRIPGERLCRDLQPAGLGAPGQSVLQSSARVLVPCLLGLGCTGRVVWLGGPGGWLTPKGLAGLHGKGEFCTKGQTVLFEHQTRTVPVCLLPAAFWAL